MGHHLFFIVLCLGTLYALYLVAQQLTAKPAAAVAAAAATNVARALLRGKRDNYHNATISDEPIKEVIISRWQIVWLV